MWALVIVEGHPFLDARFCLRAVFPSMQVEAFTFQGSPEPLDEDIVEEAAPAIHRDADARSAQAICPGKICELRSLIGVHDLWRAKLVNGLVQGLNAELRL